MKITEVQIKLVQDGPKGLLAYCSLVLDDSFAVHDLKVIRSTEPGRNPQVFMPSRKITDRCPGPECGGKNHLRARYCNNCGCRLSSGRAPRDDDGRTKLHADVAHPVRSEFRKAVEDAVLAAWEDAEADAVAAGRPITFDDGKPKGDAA